MAGREEAMEGFLAFGGAIVRMRVLRSKGLILLP
jgi:hypothetical protein